MDQVYGQNAIRDAFPTWRVEITSVRLKDWPHIHWPRKRFLSCIEIPVHKERSHSGTVCPVKRGIGWSPIIRIVNPQPIDQPPVPFQWQTVQEGYNRLTIRLRQP